ncbi:uncharacterized protein LOC125941902 [Dermacentor silvarum]|uniref:uncharacterized protein LOC125941902 n=1 Tax=Dermacentor silvarum TaxID=543639 RepID=UPI002100A1F4|nr:uncharacterized protein LOC125941902 [Dermacentor silvarum]
MVLILYMLHFQDDQADKVEQLQATVERLDSELRKTKEQLQQTQDCLDSARMVKRLKHILDKVEGGEDSRVSVVSAPKVDLGEGVLLDDATLT